VANPGITAAGRAWWGRRAVHPRILTAIDKVYTASEQEYTNPAAASHGQKRQAANPCWSQVLADGITYPHKVIYFADRQVDVRTGAIRLAGLFPNPGNSLRPGQYGRVRTATQTLPGALLVPQQAVSDLQGTHRVAVVDGNNKVSIRAVNLGETIGTQWIIRDGVKPGERVIVEGLQKVRQGMQVNPKAFQAR
jgi:membrane fusion protein (multidrug efflux system)